MSLKLWFVNSIPFHTVYDGDPPPGDPPPGDPPANPKLGDPPKTFTQEELNRILAEEKRKSLKQLEDLKKAKGLTDKEKSDLSTRIEELQNQLLTKEQLAAKEKEKRDREHDEKLQQLTAEKNTWQERYVKTTITTAIVGEASRQEAFDSDALIALLGPDTRLVEVTDGEGNATGDYEPRVKFKDIDEKEKKPVVLDLTVEQAVKRMKDMPKFGYLFKSTAAGGLGGNSGAGKGSKADPAKMTHEQYLKYRKENGITSRQ